MYILLIALAVLLVVAFFANDLRAFRDDSSAPPRPKEERPSECVACADETEQCVAERLLAGACKEVVYYDDEELDAYKGRPSGGYTEAEAEEFREVMLTMRPEEVGGWLTSLQQRDVALPDELKDEAFLLAGIHS